MCIRDSAKDTGFTIFTLRFAEPRDVKTRDEVVSKIDAPYYIMSQASGYKLVSNKEQPSGPEYTITWLLSYFKAKTNAASPTENVAQHYPMSVSYTHLLMLLLIN